MSLLLALDPTYLLAALAAFALVVISRLRTRAQSQRLPPGPPADPLIGHVRHMKPVHSWLWYHELSKTYGDIVHISAMGTPIIILNTWDVVNDLLVKRGAIYSDRPPMPMTTDILGLDKVVSLSHYGPEWKEQRRLFHTYLSKDLVEERCWSTIEHEARDFVIRTLEGQTNPPDEFRLTSLRGILKVAYDLDVKTLDDDLVRKTLKGGDIASFTALPGKFMVNVFPALMHVPDWFPGAGWKRQGKEWRKMVLEMNQIPYQSVKDAEVNGTAQQSFTRDILRGGTTLNDDWLIQTIGTFYMAGSDTTIAFVQHFIFAMVTHPEKQKKAQEEIDRVIGHDRLPNITDQADLPYVDACLKEAMRWRVVAPISVPRRLMQDDVYKGYVLPKGAMVLQHNWAISHDEKMYPNPYEFIPERFLVDNPPLDPKLYALGSGRRICPGILFAEQTAFVTMASMLACVDVVPALDAAGNEIPLDFETTGRFMNAPNPYQCRFKARSTASLALVQEAVAAHHASRAES